MVSCPTKMAIGTVDANYYAQKATFAYWLNGSMFHQPHFCNVGKK